MIKVAIITTDNRELWKRYDLAYPNFGTAPEALLAGLSYFEDEVEIHVICCTRRQMVSPTVLAKNIHFHSILIPSWGMMKSLYLGASFKIREILRAIKPDIVHGQGSEREAALASVLSGYPNIITLHGNMRLLVKFQRAGMFSFLWFIAKIESYALKRTHGTVCITHYTENLVKPLNNVTWVVPNAVDERYFKVIRTPDPNKPVLLCVGLICPRKNQIFLIEALDALQNTSSFELRLLGDCPPDSLYAREFLTLIKRRPWCSYAGFVDREQLAHELTKSSALILPSLEDNCPMVVLESMAAGLPVLAANVGGVPDLVESGCNGVLFDPEDMKSIQSVVADFLKNSSNALVMAAKARADALERFHPKVIARKHIDIYKHVSVRKF